MNVSKTKVMHFHRMNSPRCQRVFKFGENLVDYCSSYRYLGLELNDTLNYANSVDILSKSSSRSLASLIAKYYDLGELSLDVYEHVYKSLVCPVMDYSCIVWGGGGQEI